MSSNKESSLNFSKDKVNISSSSESSESPLGGLNSTNPFKSFLINNCALGDKSELLSSFTDLRAKKLKERAARELDCNRTFEDLSTYYNVQESKKKDLYKVLSLWCTKHTLTAPEFLKSLEVTMLELLKDTITDHAVRNSLSKIYQNKIEQFKTSATTILAHNLKDFKPQDMKPWEVIIKMAEVRSGTLPEDKTVNPQVKVESSRVYWNGSLPFDQVSALSSNKIRPTENDDWPKEERSHHPEDWTSEKRSLQTKDLDLSNMVGFSAEGTHALRKGPFTQNSEDATQRSQGHPENSHSHNNSSNLEIMMEVMTGNFEKFSLQLFQELSNNNKEMSMKLSNNNKEMSMKLDNNNKDMSLKLSKVSEKVENNRLNMESRFTEESSKRLSYAGQSDISSINSGDFDNNGNLIVK